MRAMVLPRFGGPELFEEKDVVTPQPGPGQVLVRIIASGVNPIDAKLRKDGSWARLTPPVVLGSDVSGVIVELGAGVTDLAVGDEVYYTPEIGAGPGSYAEFNASSASIVAKKPRGLTHFEAAAIPLAGGTAWEVIVRKLALRLGETVLIHGGAGGVGSFAVQFAKAAGAVVFASAARAHQETLERLGADVTIDYERDDAAEVALQETAGEGVDAVFDAAGGNIPRSLRAVRPWGRLASLLPVTGDLGPMNMRNLTLYGMFLLRERKRLEQMCPLFERRMVIPLLDRVIPLARVREAHERLDTGHGIGKIVLAVAEQH